MKLGGWMIGILGSWWMDGGSDDRMIGYRYRRGRRGRADGMDDL